MTDQPAGEGGDLEQRLSAALDSAVNGAMGGEGEMVTRYLAVVETMDATGARGVWCFIPDGAMAWDTLGLLAYAQQLELADMVARKVRDD